MHDRRDMRIEHRLHQIIPPRIRRSLWAPASWLFLVASCGGADEPALGDGGWPEREARSSSAAACPFTLEASREYRPTRWHDGRLELSEGTSVRIPAEIPVIAGNAGNRDLRISISTSGHETVCHYRGGARKAHPETPEEIEQGRRYRFVRCDDGAKAGDRVPVRQVTLHVESGDHKAGTTVARWQGDCQGPSRTMRVAVYLIDHLSTCFVGNPCTGDRCVGLRDDANNLVEAFADDAVFRAVQTTDPARDAAAKVVCVEMELSPTEVDEVRAELETFRANVEAWTGGALELELHVLPIGPVDLAESRWGGGVWIGPWDLRAVATPLLDFVPDFNLVVPPIRDPDQQLHHDLGGCGGTFGAEPGLGIGGAGWSWVPKTRSSFWFECAEESVFTHEWLHQVHWALMNLSGWSDLYGDSFPACGMGDPDPRKWFPDTHQCLVDPDFVNCGTADCGGNDLVNQHILSAHWDPARRFIANHCLDGVQNFGEAGVDTGGDCLGGPTATAASTSTLAGSPPTPTP
jgi:hypothetical protein